MRYSKVTSKGQVTIPKSIRKRMGIDESTQLVFVDDGDRLLAFKVNADLEKLYGTVPHTKGPTDFAALREATKEQVAARTTKLIKSGRAAGSTKRKGVSR